MQWRVRAALEQSEYEASCFVTLTYEDQCLTFDEDGKAVLDYRDFQLFMKRLRKKLGVSIRYMVAGELGEHKGQRGAAGIDNPHWHCIIFGWCPDDLTPISKYRHETYSPELMKVWTYGFNTVSEVTPGCIAYVVSYSTTKHSIARFSLRPAIGANKIMDTIKQEDVYYDGRKSCLDYRKRVISRVDPKRAERISQEAQAYSKEQYERNIVKYGSYSAYLEAESAAAAERQLKRDLRRKSKNRL